MAAETGSSLFTALIDRGLSPVHAAALVGNMQQESGLNPRAVNPDEGANGLLQWRESRWQGLQDYAKARGSSPTDRDTQLDFMLAEMQGPERRAGSRFLAATDLVGANDALKGYIRYGDDSRSQRLAYAAKALGTPESMPAAAGAAAAPPSAATAGTPAGGPIGGGSAAADASAQSAPLSLSPSVAPGATQQQASAPELTPMSPLAMPLTAAAKARLFAALALPHR